MTRHLSELLQAPEPTFRLQLRELERYNGHQNTDIKLSVEVMHAAQSKIHALGLDHQDTTPEELYHALLSRVSADDKRLERALRTRAAAHISAEADVMAGLAHALQLIAQQQQTFAIKSVVLKRTLKHVAPKRLQKMLGYRSLDAMLRGEAPALLVTIAAMVESAAWRRTWRESYRDLQATDFETKTVKVILPNGARWQSIIARVASQEAHTVASMPELGTVVLLALPANKPAGIVIATSALAVQELNTMAALSTYLRASQVHGNFTSRLQAALGGDLHLQADHFSEMISWSPVQQYFSRLSSAVHEDVFGPYVSAQDFNWHNIEQTLSDICPSLAFWENSNFISFLHQGQSVSCNLLDAALNCCNQATYKARSLEHTQQALWSELTMRYLDRSNLESAVSSVLLPQLATEMALA